MSDEASDDDDINAFRQAMRHVQPLRPSTKIQASSPKRNARPIASATTMATTATPHPGLSFHQYLEPVTAHSHLSHHCPSLSASERKQLQKGQFALAPDAILDLHGQTRHQAHDSLLSFIQYCQAQGYRYGLIIHGKSLHNPEQPSLKNSLNHWLRELTSILAFCSAKPKHGGTGAVYIRLRKLKGG